MFECVSDDYVPVIHTYLTFLDVQFPRFRSALMFFSFSTGQEIFVGVTIFALLNPDHLSQKDIGPGLSQIKDRA